MKAKHRKEIEKRLGNPRVYDKATELLQKWGMDDDLPSPEAFSKGFRLHGASFMEQLDKVLNMHKKSQFVNAGGDDNEGDNEGGGEEEPVTENPEDEEDDEDKWYDKIFGYGLKGWEIWNNANSSDNDQSDAAKAAAARQAQMNRNIMIGFGALVVVILLVVVLKK